MSSSRKPPRESRKEKSSTSRSYYPTLWSDWVWSEQLSCWQRYRLRAKGDYEYEYDKKPTSTEPRTQPAAQLDPIQESASSYGSQQGTNYTHSPIATVTEILERTNLGSSSASALGTGSAAVGVNWGPTTHIPNLIKSRDLTTTQEEFDPHYKVHGGWEFKYGRVFKILWAEPGGANDNGSHSGGQSISERKGQFGEKLFQKVRRFVIIDARQGHCICLPINTYSGKGAMKKGVQAKDHTIIYTGKAPFAFRGEQQKGLTKYPIKMNPSSPRHKLDNASRLNYAKPYTVEYNVKVWFIGDIHPEYQWQLGTDYNIVNPPVQPRGLPPPAASLDTYGHTGGGFASSSDTNSFNPYATPNSASSYGGSGYTVPPSFTSATAPTSSGQPFRMSAAAVIPGSRTKSYQSSEHASQHGDESLEQPDSPIPSYEPHPEDEPEPSSYSSRPDPPVRTSSSYSSRTAPEYPARTPSLNPPNNYFPGRSASFDANAFPEYGTRTGSYDYDKRWQPSPDPARSSRRSATGSYTSPSREWREPSREPEERAGHGEYEEAEAEAEEEPDPEAEPEAEPGFEGDEEEDLYSAD